MPEILEETLFEKQIVKQFEMKQEEDDNDSESERVTVTHSQDITSAINTTVSVLTLDDAPPLAVPEIEKRRDSTTESVIEETEPAPNDNESESEEEIPIAPTNFVIFPLPPMQDNGIINRLMGSLKLKNPASQLQQMQGHRGSFSSISSNEDNKRNSLGKKDGILNFMRKSSNGGDKPARQDILRTTSLDSVHAIRSKVVPKSILKKRDLFSSIVKQDPEAPDYVSPPPVVQIEGVIEVDEQEEEDVTRNITEEPPKIFGANTLSPLSLSEAQYRASAPDLRHNKFMSNQASPASSIDGDLKKIGSMKTLSFDLNSVAIIEVHSKNNYNRKPDSNVTFKKLTPKLKNEIREELNKYKREEMSVHEESAHYTVFH